MGNLSAKDQYCSLAYYSPQRMGQYYYQIKAIRESGAQHVLEVGPGPGVVTHILRQAGLKVTTFDCEPSLAPDLCGDIRDIPLRENTVDFTLCCQVLEHLPYEEFLKSVKEIIRVSRLGVLISLPRVSRAIYSLHKYPGGRRASWVMHFPWLPPKGEPAPGHCWEIGRKGFPERKVRHDMQAAGIKIRQSFTPADAPNNQFYIIEAGKAE